MVLFSRLQEMFIVSSLTNDQMLEEMNMQWGIMGMTSLRPVLTFNNKQNNKFY